MRLGPIALALALASTAFTAPQNHPHRASPFDAIRWEEGTPRVQVADEWYRPVSIDGLAVTEIIEACQTLWPGQLSKRFSEDLMEAMAILEVRPKDTVTLSLVRLSDGAEVTLENVPNTLERRQQLWAANSGRSEKATLSREEARVDLRAFAQGLEERFAYRDLRGVDWEAEVDSIEDGLLDSVATRDIAAELHRLMMRSGDGHASVTARGFRPGEQGPFLPFLLADSPEGVVAFAPGREAFVDPERPFVVSLAGFGIEECLAAVRDHVVDGSPQLVRRRSMRLLRDASLWYPQLSGKDDVPSLLPVMLSSVKADDAREIVVSIARRKPTFGVWPRSNSGILEGSLGYLRLESMDDDAVDEVRHWMPKFRETKGLIVDVRGNSGGSREALLVLAGYLADGPWVGNVAAYRLAEEFGDDHLDARFMYRANHEGWTDGQKAVIDEMASSFEPEWSLPNGFSDWHYLVLDKTGHSSEYDYDRPVVVLSDASCFSATDIFLGALEVHPNVTLMGTSSGGGSARSQEFRLPNSGIRVRCASMASFRPDGRLYDGRGIEVDAEVQPNPESFLEVGRDAALEAAIGFLKKR